jgi:hypothetical protein
MVKRMTVPVMLKVRNQYPRLVNLSQILKNYFVYLQHLEQIIVRDFYPDLPKLKAQAEYLDAVRTNDVVKLREIQIKYGPKRGNMKSPSICKSTHILAEFVQV